MLGDGPAKDGQESVCVDRLSARTLGEVPELLREVELRVRAGSAAAGWVSYEAAAAFDRALVTRNPLAGSDVLASFLVADEWQLVRESELDLRGGRVDLDWQLEIERGRYLEALGEIRERIRAGEVYQVNYTFPLTATQRVGEPSRSAEWWRLFANLYRAQRGPYAAYVDDGDRVVCSASPELFFARHGDRVISRPMKGTARRGLDWSEDQDRLRALLASEKERAENVMIVDMVRNDLGRIARPGTVAVDALYELETYPTVHQMVSTVSARTDAGLVDVFRALFPPASITGAPKISSMRTIAELEVASRGVYTGAVGWLLPGGRCQFNVAIRTAVSSRGSDDRDRRTWTYGTGSGVVWDSDPEAEWRECAAKALNLRHRLPRFRLLESLLLRRSGYVSLDLHLERLRRSAIYFGFGAGLGLDRRGLLERARHVLRERARCELASNETIETFKVRLLVDRRGEVDVEMEPVKLRPRASWRVALADEPISSSDRFLRHKTTYRGVYQRALARARSLDPSVADVLLFNERGELTESTNANVVLDLGESDRTALVTPAKTSGLLGGVFRERLLARGRVDERVVLLDDLERTRRLWLVNSVRGIVRVDLV